MAAFYAYADVLHFTRTDFYLLLMPSYLPWHRALVWISGAAEIGLGLALPVPRLTRLAAWGVIALLVAVFPANLHHWWANVQIPGQALPSWYHAVRLPMQGVLIAWAWWYTRQPEG